MQDAVFPITEMRWRRKRRRFALLLNRFRWEDRERRRARGPRLSNACSRCWWWTRCWPCATQGIDRADRDTVLSLLVLAFEPGEDGTGRVILTLAGDGAMALDGRGAGGDAAAT